MDTINKTKYALINIAPLSPSGFNEIVATFEYKYTAEFFKRHYNYGKQQYKIVKLSSLNLGILI